MKIDHEAMLDSDHLEELLETPAPSPPVVVVQYRNRGVPSWIFFPFVILVTGVALFLYHRMVVERYRVQAAQDRSDLARQIEAELALQPMVRDHQPSTTVLPNPDNGTAVPITPVATAARAADPSNPPKSVADAATSPPLYPGSPDDPTPPGPPRIIGRSGPLPRISESGIASGASGPPLAGQNANLTTRSIVPNPFEEGASPPKPPIPNDGAGSTASARNAELNLALPAGNLADNSPPVAGPNRGQGSAGPADNWRKDAAARSSSASTATNPAPGGEHRAGGLEPLPQGPDGDGRIDPEPLRPLPTREETERAIEAEAAENATRLEKRDDALRSRRLEEQVKFHQELQDVLQSKGNQAGPDIASLDKRYGYEVDPHRFQRAYQAWRSRMAERAKVDFVRSLDLPETVILEFMCASIHSSIGQRDGPRDENEVRVRAARRLLRYGLVKPGAGQRPVTGAGAGNSTTRKPVVSTPR